MLLVGMIFAANFNNPTPAKAQAICQIKQTGRTLFSHRPINIERQIQLVMRSAELEGEVQQILWADGLQAYQFIGNKPEIYAPSAELFSVESLGKDIYLFNSQKIQYSDRFFSESIAS